MVVERGTSDGVDQNRSKENCLARKLDPASTDFAVKIGTSDFESETQARVL